MQTLNYDLCSKALDEVQNNGQLAIFQVQPDVCFAICYDAFRKEYTVECCKYKDGLFTSRYAEFVKTPKDVLDFCIEFYKPPIQAERSGYDNK